MDKDKLEILQNSINRYRYSCSRSKVPNVQQRLNDARGELGNLVDNLNRINRLSQIFDEIIEKPLSDHCRVAHWRENILVLAVDSNTWASRLRFEKLNLLNTLRQQGFPSISSIDVIVRPDEFK